MTYVKKENQTLIPQVLETGSNELEILDFRMYEILPNNSIYEWALGVNVAKVREVMSVPKNIFKCPGLPPEIVGITKIRQEVVPIFKLDIWMKIRTNYSDKHLIVMEFLGEVIGTLVHDTRRIRRIRWSDIKQPPKSMQERLKGKIIGVIPIKEKLKGNKDNLLLLLDFESILHELGMVKMFGEISSSMKKQVEEEKETLKKETQVDTLRILILDDSSLARKVLRETLEKAGFEVLEAQSGLEALNILKELEKKAAQAGKKISDYIQCIVSDIEMPGMDGLTFTKKLRQDPKYDDIPIIINTTLSDSADIQKAKQVGADEHIVKFKHPNLIKLILDLIEKRRKNLEKI